MKQYKTTTPLFSVPHSSLIVITPLRLHVFHFWLNFSLIYLLIQKCIEIDVSMESSLEIVVGTYENFLLGYTLTALAVDNDPSNTETEVDQTYTLTPSFTNNSHCGSVRSICSVHKYIGSGSTDEVIRLLNLDSRTEHGTLQHHNGTITCLTAFHSYLFSGSDDGTICIWKTGSWLCEKTLHAHAEGVLGISIHPSGKLALSIGQDRSLKTWNLIKGRAGYTTNLKGIAHAVEWSTDGNYYAISIATRLDVYSLESAKVIYTVSFGSRIAHIVFPIDGIVLIAGDSENVQVHDVAKGIHLTSFLAHKSRVKGMKYHHEQQLLITTSNADQFIKVWKFPVGSFSKPPRLLTELNTTCRVTCLTLWDKSLLPLKKQSDEEETENLHEILQEDDEKNVELEEAESGASENDEMEFEQDEPEPPQRKKPSKKVKTATTASKEPTEADFRDHKKSKRFKRK